MTSRHLFNLKSIVREWARLGRIRLVEDERRGFLITVNGERFRWVPETGSIYDMATDDRIGHGISDLRELVGVPRRVRR